MKSLARWLQWATSVTFALGYLAKASILLCGWGFPRDARRIAPSSMLYPMRRYALWPLLAGLTLYFCLPRAKTGPQVLRYSHSSAGLLPNLVGALLLALFFALPLAIIPATSSTGRIFEGDWLVLVVVCWALERYSLLASRSYCLSPKSPLSAFTNREASPFWLISRISAE